MATLFVCSLPSHPMSRAGRETTGVIDNISYGSVQFKRPSMHNIRTVKTKQLNGIQPSLISVICFLCEKGLSNDMILFNKLTYQLSHLPAQSTQSSLSHPEYTHR